MVYHLRSPGFARQLDTDLHTLVHRGNDRRVSFGDRLVALDRIAGTTLIACTMVAALWLTSVVADSGLLRIPSATADSASTATETQTAHAVADRLKWSEVRNLQIKLSELGFDAGKPDGIAGARTLDALNRYRATQSLDRISWVDRSTIAHLLD
jgi:hypothetical protein